MRERVRERERERERERDLESTDDRLRLNMPPFSFHYLSKVLEHAAVSILHI